MELIYTLTDNHVHQLHALYQQEWWTQGRTLEETKNGVNGSQVCVGLIDNELNLVGFARVLSDFTFKALIFDFIVCKEHRERGLGSQLMSAIKNHDKLKTVRHFELYCLPEMFPYYEKYDFTTDVGQIKLMRCNNSPPLISD